MRKLMLVLAVALLLIAGCSKAPSEIDRTSIAPGSYCTENAKQLVPDQVKLYSNEGWMMGPDPANSWKDGQNLTFTNNDALFRAGKNQGENINYYYIDDASGASYVVYSKQIVKKDGTIIGTKTFTISPVLRPIPGTDGKRQVWLDDGSTISYNTKKFMIMDYSFIECNWVE